jgi:hypothetical protein
MELNVPSPKPAFGILITEAVEQSSFPEVQHYKELYRKNLKPTATAYCIVCAYVWLSVFYS